MDILDRISALLNGREQRELTNYLGLKSVAFSEWKSGKSKSYRKYLIEIAEYFNVSIDYLVYGKNTITSALPDLSDNERELLNTFNQLSQDSKMRLLGRAETLLELELKKETAEQRQVITILSSEYRVSAGKGIMLDDDNLTEITVPDTPEARRADFALTICGDSMEPIYHDKDIVLVKKMPCIDVGEIGIFYVDGSGYIKKYGGDRLVSLNSAYDDILFDENTEIRCFGKVIGRA